MVWHLPVLQGCVIHRTSYIFPEAGESFRKAGDMGGEFVSDPQFLLAGHPPMLILAVLLACAGPGLGLLFGLLVSLHLVCLFSVLKCRFCTGFSIAILVTPLFGWTEWLIPRPCVRFLSNLSLQMSVLQHRVKWCFAFYVCKQHMVCSQLLKLTKYLRICLNARSYRKCKFITYCFSLDSYDRFLESAPRRVFLVLSLLFLHAYANFLSLLEPHNTCYQ